MQDEGWRELAASIVWWACSDYMIAQKNKEEYEMRRLERWFRSDWCYELCGVEGDKIIKALQKLHEEGKFLGHRWIG